MPSSDPYLPLRDLVRPLANSYATLRQQRLRSGELVDEVDQLGELAKRLLCQLGEDSIEEATWLPVADDSEATFAVWMAEAYGDARTAWEDLLVAVDALAERWIEADEAERVNRLADYLEVLGLSSRAFAVRSAVVCQPVRLMLKNKLDVESLSNFFPRWGQLERWVRDHQDDVDARDLVVNTYFSYVSFLYREGLSKSNALGAAEDLKEFSPTRAVDLTQFINGLKWSMA